MAKKKNKKKKVKIAYCTWCRKVLKAGEYHKEGRDSFCGDKCLSEWNVKQSIVLRTLDGQKSLVEKSGLSVLELEKKAHGKKIEAIRDGSLKKGESVTVDELLQASTEEKELRTIAGKIFGVKLRKTVHPAILVLSGALFALVIYLITPKVIAFVAGKKSNATSDLSSIGMDSTVFSVDSTEQKFAKEISYLPEAKPERQIRQPLSDKPQPIVFNSYGENLNFTRGNIDKPMVALTFDAGAHLEEAFAILDTLKSRNVKCTFFLTGFFARKFRNVVVRLKEDGHEIGNHTWSHPHLTTFEVSGKQITSDGISEQYLMDELNKTDSLLRYITGGEVTRFWRAPYGEMNRDICGWAEHAGYKHIGWTQGTSWRTNLDTNDWVVEPNDPLFFYPSEVLDKLLKFGHGTGKGLNGGIVLMHIGTIREKHKMVESLGVLIDSLHNRNYSLVKISELMEG